MLIPIEARQAMQAYREGLTEKQYLKSMWDRRMNENPVKTRSRWKWPISQESNVIPIWRKKP